MNLDDYEKMVLETQAEVKDCPVCGKRPVMNYEPGCLSAECQCKVWARDDEDREAMVEEINERFEEIAKNREKSLGRLSRIQKAANAGGDQLPRA